MAEAGDTVRLTGFAADPDGDSVSLEWWQLDAVDTYEGAVAIGGRDSASSIIEIPDDAQPGQTIHVILQATDDAPLPLSRYQRVVITVGSR